MLFSGSGIRLGRAKADMVMFVGAVLIVFAGAMSVLAEQFEPVITSLRDNSAVADIDYIETATIKKSGDFISPARRENGSITYRVYKFLPQMKNNEGLYVEKFKKSEENR